MCLKYLCSRPDGSVLKEMLYSPFGGKALKDTNPSMTLPLGFKGFLAIPHADFMYDIRARRFYHPQLVQYLNPDWESLVHR